MSELITADDVNFDDLVCQPDGLFMEAFYGLYVRSNKFTEEERAKLENTLKRSLATAVNTTLARKRVKETESNVEAFDKLLVQMDEMQTLVKKVEAENNELRRLYALHMEGMYKKLETLRGKYIKHEE